MKKVQSQLKTALQAIQNALNVSADEAGIDARLLLQHVLGVNHAWIIAHGEDLVVSAQLNEYDQLLQRRLLGEPIAYIVGEREFYGLLLQTNKNTLIPRPDSEALVEVAISKLDQNKLQNVLDLGTGTGAIALAIASVRPLVRMTAVDFSLEALAVAKENANQLGLNEVKFIQSNWFNALTGECFDIIVSNPPYIAKDDAHLRQGDLRFEPLAALVSGNDGLDDIRIIIQEATHHLNDEGWLLLEHGYDQASDVAQLLADANFSYISHALDLAGIERVTLGCWQPNS